MARPVVYVLAGVNGAGKSSIGGHLLQQAGLTWFNPDTFARELMAAAGCGAETANAHAWREGMRRLDAAMAAGQNFAFETTLGGETVASKIMDAMQTHDVLMWFCGLASPELHIRRVAAGGHAIPEARIRERYPRAQLNLIRLMRKLAYLQVYDNSVEAAADGTIPDPLLVMEMESGRILWPASNDIKALQGTPEWAKSILESALSGAPAE